jgi:hypothetical protein
MKNSNNLASNHFSINSFLLKDAKTKMWFDAGEVYAREKVSHALRSRPNEERRKRPKPIKKTLKKPKIAPQLEMIVQELISEQQRILNLLIVNETIPGGTVESRTFSGND